MSDTTIDPRDKASCQGPPVWPSMASRWQARDNREPAGGHVQSPRQVQHVASTCPRHRFHQTQGTTIPAFSYQALKPDGKNDRGVLQADTARGARQMLRERGLVPVAVDEVAGQSEATQRWGLSRPALNGSRRALFLRELATLLTAGLPIDEALDTMARQGSEPRTRTLVLSMRSKVMEGASLADAMAGHGRSFPELYQASVAAGERSGRLDEILSLLADEAEARDATRQSIWAALAYPLLLAIVATLIVAGLLVYVVPQITAVFVRMHETLPWTTRALLATSDFLRDWGLWVGLALIIILAGLRMLLRGPAWQRRRDALLLRLPGIGPLLRTAGTARATATLALLTASAVPLLDALKISARVVPNLAMREALQNTASKVREGASLARALDATGQFPPVALRLIAAGERAGSLEKMLREAAAYCNRQLDRVINVLTAVLGPILILVVGAMVLFIVLAILQPVFNINQLVR